MKQLDRILAAGVGAGDTVIGMLKLELARIKSADALVDRQPRPPSSLRPPYSFERRKVRDEQISDWSVRSRAPN